MSQSGVACTPRSEPSLTDITKTLPSSMATIVCLTFPPSISFAAPMVRLPMPETMVARSAADPLGPLCVTCSALTGVSGSEESRSSPSDETTATERSPGTSSTRFFNSQCRFRASLLSPNVLGAVNYVPPRHCPPRHRYVQRPISVPRSRSRRLCGRSSLLGGSRRAYCAGPPRPHRRHVAGARSPRAW